jgi:DnaJ-class molecular chaperone
MKCVCASLGYRNNNDGSRDYKVIGRGSCRVCRGSGWVRKCEDCEGTGIFNSKPCYYCGGNGKRRQEGPDQ